MFSLRLLISFLLVGIYQLSWSQSESDYIAILTPSELITKANSVVRFDKQTIEINDFDEMLVTTHRIVTIFNKYGDDRHWNAYEGYDENTTIKKMEAHIFDASGNEIKKFKKNDFVDQSAVSGATLYSDSRIKFLSYTPVNYPYTLEYISEVAFKSTAFVPQWRPIDDYYVSVQYSEYEIVNNSPINIKTKKENFDNYNIESSSDFKAIARNLEAVKYEQYSPNLTKFTPCLKAALETFNMEGVKGVNTDWEVFGKWMHTNLIEGTDVIPQSAIDEVKALTNGIEDRLARAKLVYEYMQNKTRYISVQVGIGGWKPMLAQDVDRLGYADCKGLTNYTKALLEAVDVPSYYTVIYGGESVVDMDNEFSATEGNHVILCIPDENDNVFLECTSQTNPFGFTAGFTDDRDALIITPEGGKIVRTKEYRPDESVQKTTANILLNEEGSLTATLSIETTGYQYNLHEGIQNQTLRDQKVHYKEYWDYLNNLDILSITHQNNKDTVAFTENLEIAVANYASKTGTRLILQPNILNRITNLPTRYEKRQLNFEVERGYKDVDEFIIQLPDNLKVEALFEADQLTTKYGTYQSKIEEIEGNRLRYTRAYAMNKGKYDKSDYDDFRNFIKEVVKKDKTKIVLIK